MPLTLYPAVDIKDGRAVRLTQGKADQETVYDADPVAAAQRFADAGTEWLHVVDLDAAFTGEPRNRHLIEQVVEATGCRVQASGGVRTLEDVQASLDYGAERVVIGTMALSDPDFVRRVLDAVGPRIAVGLDARGRTLQARGWTEEAGDLFEAIDAFSAMGVPRFVYTDVAKDGMLQGPNVDMLQQVADATDAARHRVRRRRQPRRPAAARRLPPPGRRRHRRQGPVRRGVHARGGPRGLARRPAGAGRRPVSLAARVIPCLDVTDGRVVKGINFVDLRDAGDPVELARVYDREGADELVFLDITASSDDRDTMVDVVERVAEPGRDPVRGRRWDPHRRRRAPDAARGRGQGRVQHRGGPTPRGADRGRRGLRVAVGGRGRRRPTS